MYQSDLKDVLFEVIDLPANSPLGAEDIVGDGVNYGEGILWQSPEGNFYGHTKWVANWYLHLLWDGRNYINYAPKGTVASVDNLPIDATYMDVWSVMNADVVRDPQYQSDSSIEIAFLPSYYYDPDTDDGWNPVEFGRFIEDTADVPYPGYRIGAVITVILHDVMVYWDGFTWKLPKHSNLSDDEPERHLPAGFINFITPDVKLVYGSRKLLFLDKVSGGTGFINVNKQIIYGGNSCCVYNTFPVLDYVGGAIVLSALQSSTGYYVYLANKTSQFSVTFNNIPYDFRGKLFLSTTIPDYTTFGGLADAIVVGRIETTSEGYFRHELDISWISRRPSFQESYRDYSDFVLSYVDINEIRLYCMDGHYGQMYIPEELIYLGNDLPVYFDSPRVEIDADEQPVMDVTEILPNTEYFLYIINEVDAVNFNEINEETGRPWCRNDPGAEDYYDADKDLRLRVVLSTKSPEPEAEFRNNIVPLTCGRMTESYPLFYSRYLGHVWTDAYGYFLYAKDISAIRTLALNPTHFRGQADFAIKPFDENIFKVAEIEGTAGAVQVGGETLFALPEDYDDVHEFNVNDYEQYYTEANLSSPLSNLTTVISQPTTTFYIYLCNNDTCWGARANKLFASVLPPTRGYLSVNYPGTGARWIATIKTDANGQLTGYWLVDSPGNQDAALLNLNDIAQQLSLQTSELYDHDSQLDFHDQLIMDMLGVDSNYFLWLASLSLAVQDAYSDLGELSGDISNLGVDYDNIYSLTVDMSGEIDDLYSDISAIQDNLPDLYSDLMAISQITDNIISDIYQLSVGISMLSNNTSDLFSDVDDLRDVASAIGDDVDDIISDLGDASGIMSDIQSDINDISLDISNISQDVINLQSDYLVISGLVSQADSLTDLLSLDILSLGSDLDTLSGQLSLADSLIDDISEHFSFMISDLYDVSAILGSLESDINQMYSDLSYNLSEPWRLWSDIDVLSGDLSNLQDEMGDVWSHVDSVESDIYDLQSLFDNIDLTIDSLYSDYMDLSFTISQLDEIIESLISARDTMFADVDLLVCHLGDLEQHYSNLVEDFNYLDSVFSGLDVDVLDLSFHVVQLSDVLSNFDEDMLSLSGTVDFIELVYSNLVIDVGDLSEAVVSALSDYYDMSDNVSLLLSDLDELSETWSNMDRWVESLQSDLFMASEHIWEVYSDMLNVSEAFDGLISGLADGFIGDFRYPTYDWVGKRFKYEDQKHAGLPIRVTWFYSNMFMVEPTEDNVQIVLPNACIAGLRGKACIFTDVDKPINATDGMHWLMLKGPAYGGTIELGEGGLCEIELAGACTGYSLNEEVVIAQGSNTSGTAVVNSVTDGIVDTLSLLSGGGGYAVGDEFYLGKVSDGSNRTARARVTAITTSVPVVPSFTSRGAGYSENTKIKVVQGSNKSLVLKVDTVGSGAVTGFTIVESTGNEYPVVKSPEVWIVQGTNKTAKLCITELVGDQYTPPYHYVATLIAEGVGYTVANNLSTQNVLSGNNPGYGLVVNITSVGPDGSIKSVSVDSVGVGYYAQDGLLTELYQGNGTGAVVNIAPYHVVDGYIDDSNDDGWVIVTGGENYEVGVDYEAHKTNSVGVEDVICHGFGATFKAMSIVDGFVGTLSVSAIGDGYYAQDSVPTTGGVGTMLVNIKSVYMDRSYYYFSSSESNRKIYSSMSVRRHPLTDPDVPADSVEIAYIVAPANNCTSGPWNLWSIYGNPDYDVLSTTPIGDAQVQTVGKNGDVMHGLLVPSIHCSFRFERSNPDATRFRIDVLYLAFDKVITASDYGATSSISTFNVGYINSKAGPFIYTLYPSSVLLGVPATPHIWDYTITKLPKYFQVQQLASDANTPIHTVYTEELGYVQPYTRDPCYQDFTGGLLQTFENYTFLNDVVQSLGATVSVDNAGCAGVLIMYRVFPEKAVILRSKLQKSQYYQEIRN